MKSQMSIGVRAMVATIVALAILIGVIANIVATSNNNDRLRAHLYEKAAALGINIERHLVEAIEISNAVKTAIALNPDIDTQQYDILARELRRDRAYILNIAAAPDLVTKFVHPIEPNASVIGFDLKSSKAQRDAAELARKVNRSIVAGPLELVQGGSGFIIRTPVTIDEGGDQSRFWGIVSVVMSSAQLFGLTQEAVSSNFEVAIRGRNGLGLSGDIVFGSPQVFAEDPVVFDVNLSYGQWQIGMKPADGWNTLPPQTALRIWGNIALIAMVAIGAILIALRFKSDKDRAESDLAEAIESIEDGFAMFDREDRLMLCNSRYQSIYQLPDKLTMRGTPFEDLLKYGLERGHYPDGQGREQEWLKERLLLHRNPADSFNQLLDDGRWMKIAESKTASGMIVGFRVDITDMKNAQEAAERANQIKSQFLNNINHEMRTPLTVMLGYAAMLGNVRELPSFQNIASARNAAETADDLPKQSAALAKDITNVADRIQSAGQHLLALINDSLDLARIEAGHMHVHVEPVSLANVVGDLASDFARRLEENGLDLKIGMVDFSVLADEVRLRQILMNVIDNAIKFTDKGQIEIYAGPQGKDLVIEVADTGCGIAPKHLSRIFTEFYQGDLSDTRNYGGTGLGLSICQNLAKLQGGSVSVQSKEGVGTRVLITLPLAESAQDSAPGSQSLQDGTMADRRLAS